MRISDWSPDVCSSDLLPLTPAASPLGEVLRAAIVAIPHGETASYGQVARAVESGPRAVGQACARNPFPIIVPCHRVLGNGGSLGHYSGGHGVETKLALLRLESPGFQHIRRSEEHTSELQSLMRIS